MRSSLVPISVESHWLLFFVTISTSFDAIYTAPSCARASSSMPIPLQTSRHNNERWGLVHRGRGGTSRGGEDSWVSEKYTSRLSRHWTNCEVKSLQGVHCHWIISCSYFWFCQHAGTILLSNPSLLSLSARWSNSPCGTAANKSPEVTPTPWKWKKSKQQKSEMVEVYAPFNGGFTRIKYDEMEIKHYVAKVVIVCYCI